MSIRLRWRFRSRQKFLQLFDKFSCSCGCRLLPKGAETENLSFDLGIHMEGIFRSSKFGCGECSSQHLHTAAAWAASQADSLAEPLLGTHGTPSLMQQVLTSILATPEKGSRKHWPPSARSEHCHGQLHLPQVAQERQEQHGSPRSPGCMGVLPAGSLLHWDPS